MRVAVAALFATGLLAGCMDAPRLPGEDVPAELVAPAPWWPTGSWWEMAVTRGGQTEIYRLAVFRNDTAHFWLGVESRQQALAHALWDTNPFLGRIHHQSLAPHESGRHAVMFEFPLRDGASWNGFLLRRTWSFEARAQETQFLVEGSAPDGSRIAYDYHPPSHWFTHLEERDPGGGAAWSAQVTDYGDGARGTHWFLRGLDLYEAGGGSTRDDEFTVDEDLDSLALHIGIRANGPTSIQFYDPGGQLAYQEPPLAAGGSVNRTVEVEPQRGEWTVRYLAPSGFTGKVAATGLLEESGAP